MSEDEKKYTLAEARKILAARDCFNGHTELTENITGDGDVFLIVCAHCGARYKRVES